MMAHYAFLDDNNLVTHVIPGVDEWEQIEGKDPETWYAQFVGQTCKRTSYNGNIRGRYAGIGYRYDETLDMFIAPQPYPSWTLDQAGDWQPPTPYPTDGGMYVWDEETLTWIESEQPLGG
jgi:hypothetical protein